MTFFWKQSEKGISDVQIEQKLNDTDPFEGWIISDPIDDRGSTFISYAYKTNSEEAFKKIKFVKVK